MTDLSKINFFGSFNLPEKVKVKKETAEQTKEEAPKKPDVNFKSADEVLSFMAKTGEFHNVNKGEKAAKIVEVSKYVTPEQAKRIAGFVQEFEGSVKDGLQLFEKEFGHMGEYKGMSEAAKMDVALNSFLVNNMPDVADNPIS
jgi:hypothetical protein